MNRKIRLIMYLLPFSIIMASAAQAQDEDTNAMRDTASIQTPAELLSKFSFGSALGNEAYSVPKVAIKTYKFAALIGKGTWDLNLTNSVPAFSVNSNNGEQYMRNDLIRQLGGAVNFSLGRSGYFANGKNASLKDIKGARFEFRAGGKVLDAIDELTQKRNFVPVFQSTLDIGFMIPLFNPQQAKTKAKRTAEDMVGNLSIRFIGAGMYIASTEVYNGYYTSRKGIAPDPSIMAGTFDVFFYITNKLYVNFGYSFSNQQEIKPIPYLSISYGKLD